MMVAKKCSRRSVDKQLMKDMVDHDDSDSNDVGDAADDIDDGLTPVSDRLVGC